MAYGVIGNTTVSGTVILGSSPGRPAEFPGSSRRVTEGAVHRSSAPRSSSGLGHRPLTAAARVQIPYGVPMCSYTYEYENKQRESGLRIWLSLLFVHIFLHLV